MKIESGKMVFNSLRNGLNNSHLCPFNLSKSFSRYKYTFTMWWQWPIVTWPNGLNNCLRSFSVASKATFLTINFVELLSLSIFFSTCSSFLARHSCRMRAWPSRTVPWNREREHQKCIVSSKWYGLVWRMK